MSPLEQQQQGFIDGSDRKIEEDLKEMKRNMITFLTTRTPGTVPADENAREQQREDVRDPNRIGLYW